MTVTVTEVELAFIALLLLNATSILKGCNSRLVEIEDILKKRFPRKEDVEDLEED